MAGVITSAAQVAMLKSALGKSGGIDFPLTLKLFSNNFTPVVGSTIASFTEVTGGGYADIDYSDASDVTVTSGTGTTAIWDDFGEFLFTGATGGSHIVYGYYLVDDDDNVLAAELLAVPVTPAAATLIRVKPSFTLSNAP